MKGFKLAGKSRWLAIMAAVLALVSGIFYTLGLIGAGEKVAPGTTATAPRPVPANVKTQVAVTRAVDNKQAWPGVIRSRAVAQIAPKLTARIVSVNVNSGDKVKKGEIIARLDQRAMRSAYHESESALAAANAVAARARADLKRSRYLYGKQAATRASHDAAVADAGSAQAAVDQAASAVEQMRSNLAETALRAPFDGIISERLKEAGDMGLPGDPVVTMLKPDQLRLEAAIPDACAERIKLGMAVRVRTDALPDGLMATVDEIVPEIDRQTGTRLVKAALPVSAGLQQGQFAWLEQSCDDRQPLLLIPVSAVLHYGQLEAVNIVADNQVYTRHIRTGKRQGGSVEVLSGLRAGETIITGGGIDPEPDGGGN